jgi:hypothetical protein
MTSSTGTRSSRPPHGARGGKDKAEFTGMNGINRMGGGLPGSCFILCIGCIFVRVYVFGHDARAVFRARDTCTRNVHGPRGGGWTTDARAAGDVADSSGKLLRLGETSV